MYLCRLKTEGGNVMLTNLTISWKTFWKVSGWGHVYIFY